MVGKIAIVIFVLLFSAFAIFELYVFFIHEPEEVITEVAFYDSDDYYINITFYDDRTMYVSKYGKNNYDTMGWHAYFTDDNKAEFVTAKGGITPMYELFFYDGYLELVYTGTGKPFNDSDFGKYDLLSSIKVN